MHIPRVGVWTLHLVASRGKHQKNLVASEGFCFGVYLLFTRTDFQITREKNSVPGSVRWEYEMLLRA